MTKRLPKRILAVVLALLMLVSVTAPVFAKMGSSDMPWLKKQSLLNQILQRDGFIDGIWYPWLNDGKTGHNLSGNEVMAMYYATSEENAKEWSRVELDYLGADEVYRQIYNLKAMGYNMMAWGGSIFAEGVKLDLNTGDVLGIKDDYLANARRLLNMCREIGMPVVWNVYFHSSSMPHYYGVDGWNIVARMAADPTVADHYAERFVRPLCKMLADYPDVIAMVSIADEPENDSNDPELGDHYEGMRAAHGVTRDSMMYLLKNINNVVKQELPNVARTVAATGGTNKSYYAELGLDLTGYNNYNNNSHVPEIENFKTNRPVILGEYNVGGDAGESDDELTAALIKFRENMMKKGYKGGLQWCWMPTTTWRNTSYYLLNSKNTTDFRGTVTDLRHYMDEYRAKYQGKTITVDAAVLYANKGTGLVEWIPSKRGVKMDLYRSNDGGKNWIKVLDNVDQSKYVKNKKGSYQDTKTANSQYKIVVRDAKGNAAESTPNNVAGAEAKYIKEMTTKVPAQIGISNVKGTWKLGDRRLSSFGVQNNRPANASANLIKNGSFESNDGQWTSMLGSTVSVVADKTAPAGGKSLYFNSTGLKSGNFNTKFTVKVQKNTDYVFSTWVKGAYLGTNNKGKASIGVINPDTGKFLVHTALKTDANGKEKYDSGANSAYPRASREDQQIYPNAWDNQWHLRSVMFNSGNLSEVTIALYGYGSTMWVDDMALFKNGDGVKYMTERAKSNLSVNLYSDLYTCPDSKCVNQNPSVEGDSYWKTGTGWDSGFMSVASGGKSGKALKYSAYSATGIYYVKWVDVTPNTDYVFSLDAKILKSGEGRIGLLSDSMIMPTDAVYLEFDQDTYGKNWVDFCVTFNSSGFSRVGIAVCDLGGQALIDNIQLFKKADGTVTDGTGVQLGGVDNSNPGNAGNGGNGGGNNNGGTVNGNTQTDDSTVDNSDVAVGGEYADTENDSSSDKKDKNNKKDKETSSFQLTGPVLLAISFGGTAVVIGLGVGIYFIIRAIVKKSKKAPVAAAPATEAEVPAEEVPTEENPAE